LARNNGDLELGKIIMSAFGFLPRSIILAVIGAVVFAAAAYAGPSSWKREWKKTDFTKHSVDFSEIMSGGPPKDGIPSIDDPKFVTLAELKDVADTEPVIGFSHNGDARAYPLRILIWHEIVNDVVGGLPITVTYCPLCNSAIVFDRRLDGQVLDFGTTGKLRKSDLVMYDRQTESWWQQFLGEAIVGEMGHPKKSDFTVLGDTVNVASRIESANKLEQTQLLVSQRIHDLLEGELEVGKKVSTELKGKTGAFQLSEVLGLNEAASAK